MRAIIELMIAAVLMLPATAPAAEKGLTVKSARFFSYASFTRIVFEIETAAPYVLTRADDGRSLVLSAYDAALTLKAPLPSLRDGIVAGMERRDEQGRPVIVIHLDAAAGEVKDFVLRSPDRIVVDIAKGASPAPKPSQQVVVVLDAAAGEVKDFVLRSPDRIVVDIAKGAAPAPKPSQQVVVVLDAGHGGSDAGVTTPQGPEKNIALALAQALRGALQRDPRLKVILTREKDQALSMNDRSALANTADAAVFVSIHVAPGAAGRVYIEDPDEDLETQAVQPASRDFLSFETGNERQEMLWGRQQAAHARESGLLGRSLARELGGRNDAEPLQARLAGLRAIDAAAVMIEIGAGQDRAAATAAAARGIERYVGENR